MSRAGTAASAGAVAFLLAAAVDGEPLLDTVRAAIGGAALGSAALVDLYERRIPNRIVVPALATCAFFAVGGGPAALAALTGPLLLSLALLLLAVTRPGVLGMGDVKTAFVVALALGSRGAAALVLGLGLAACAGLTLVARDGLAAFGRRLPLAPFLAIGALLALALG